jgi:hypothetical protein
MDLNSFIANLSQSPSSDKYLALLSSNSMQWNSSEKAGQQSYMLYNN